MPVVQKKEGGGRGGRGGGGGGGFKNQETLASIDLGIVCANKTFVCSAASGRTVNNGNGFQNEWVTADACRCKKKTTDVCRDVVCFAVGCVGFARPSFSSWSVPATHGVKYHKHVITSNGYSAHIGSVTHDAPAEHCESVFQRSDAALAQRAYGNLPTNL